MANPILSDDTEKKELLSDRFKKCGRQSEAREESMASTTMTVAPWQMGSQSHTASMISRVIGAPCMSPRLTERSLLATRKHREVVALGRRQ